MRKAHLEGSYERSVGRAVLDGTAHGICCLNALPVFKVWLQKEAWEVLGQPGIAIAELLRVSKMPTVL